MEHFNSPPGWPRPPFDWRPQPGWQPDPKWPAPPPGWNFWLDDHGYPSAGPHGLYGARPLAPETPRSGSPLAGGGVGTPPHGASATAGSEGTKAKPALGCLVLGVLLLALMGGCISLFNGDKKSDNPGSSSTTSTSSSSTGHSSTSTSPTPAPTSTSTGTDPTSPTSRASSSGTVPPRSSSRETTANDESRRSTTSAPSSSTSTTADTVPQPTQTATETPIPDPGTATQEPQRLVPTTDDGAAGGYYSSCKAARAAGAGPFYRGGPGYRPALDRDGDGVACE